MSSKRIAIVRDITGRMVVRNDLGRDSVCPAGPASINSAPPEGRLFVTSMADTNPTVLNGGPQFHVGTTKEVRSYRSLGQ